MRQPARFDLNDPADAVLFEWSAGADKRVVDMTFGATRSRLRGIRLDVDGRADYETFIDEDGQQVHRWTFERPPDRDAEVPLIVEFDGQPPYLATVRWYTVDEAGRVGSLGDESERGKKIRAWFDRNRAAIRARWSVLPDGGSEAAEFFLELDRVSSSELVDYTLPPKRDARQIGFWRQYLCDLQNQLHYRLRDRIGGCSPEQLRSVAGLLVERISRELLPLLRRYFPGEARAVDPARVMTGFARFAAGDFRFCDAPEFSNGHPNGGFFFLFAELALLASRECRLAEHDREDWKALLGPLVMAQRVYVHAYGPPPRKLDDYGGLEPAQVLPHGRRAELVAGWSGAVGDLEHWERRIVANVWEAFEGRYV